jgi:hypothetical protein
MGVLTNVVGAGQNFQRSNVMRIICSKLRLECCLSDRVLKVHFKYIYKGKNYREWGYILSSPINGMHFREGLERLTDYDVFLEALKEAIKKGVILNIKSLESGRRAEFVVDTILLFELPKTLEIEITDEELNLEEGYCYEWPRPPAPPKEE